MRIPLFPLNSVLFPGGQLTLRIFEPRYLGMVSDCLRRSSPLGICLIRQGTEVGPAAQPFAIGTLGRIVDWEKRDDGLLGITVLGERRFEIQRQEVGPLQLLLGQVTLLEDAPPLALPEEYQPLRQLLERILEQLPMPHLGPPRYHDAGWVACRLTEILPIPLRQKQALLEQSDPLERLRQLHQLLQPET